MAGLYPGVVGSGRWSGAEEAGGGPERGRSQPHGGPDSAAHTLTVLVRTIEGEVIPRLMLAHRTGSPSQRGAEQFASVQPTAAEVVEVARLAVAHDVPVVLSYVEALRSRGMMLETVFLELLAPAARYLGEMWKEDLCNFTDVTLGLCRLHQALTELGSGSRTDIGAPDGERRALLAPAPGEQHTFGVLMVSEFFRRAGWDTVHISGAMDGDVLQAVRCDWFDVVGFSLSCESRAEPLAATIRSVRRASRNPALGVLVGGRVFGDNPELVTFVGADATAVDGRQAPQQAGELLDLVARRC